MLILLWRLFIAALWSPAEKGLTSKLPFVMFKCVCYLTCGILGQVCYLIVLIPYLCHLSYFNMHTQTSILKESSNAYSNQFTTKT